MKVEKTEGAVSLRRNPRGQIEPGSGGRPKGARNKLQADFVNALQKDFKEHGESVIRIVRTEEPAQYLKIIANVIPREDILSGPDQRPIEVSWKMSRVIIDPPKREEEPKLVGAAVHTFIEHRPREEEEP